MKDKKPDYSPLSEDELDFILKEEVKDTKKEEPKRFNWYNSKNKLVFTGSYQEMSEYSGYTKKFLQWIGTPSQKRDRPRTNLRKEEIK